MQSIFELVPNISEGRDASVVDEAAAAMERCGVRVAHRTSDHAHHRSVLTAFGDARAVVEAAVALAEVTTRRIDLRTHSGEHPRIGALDVLPFVPIVEATLEDAARLAHRAAREIWERLGVPSFYYEAASSSERPRLLSEVRRGGFEGLAQRALRGERPDVGETIAHPSAGAVAVGARRVLVAFNVELASGDVVLARRIARALRERDGGLRTLRVLGLRLQDGCAQISCNLTDVEAVPLHRVVGLVKRLAQRHGVSVRACELIGLIPRKALATFAAHTLGC